MAEQRKPEQQKGKVFTELDEIVEHNTKDSCWLLIDGKVYDVTKFKHPGGKQILLQNSGQDATTQFEDIGHSEKADEYLKELYIGDFKPPEDDDAGKRAALAAEDDGMLTKLILVVVFLGILGFLYTQVA